MKNDTKVKQIGFFVVGSLLVLAIVVAVVMLLRNYTLNHIDISQAEDIFLVAQDDLIPIEEEDETKLIAIFSDAEAHPDNLAILACPFDRGFLFQLPKQRGVLLSYSNDDCGVIRMQPMEMGQLTYWFKAYNQQEDLEYLQGLYQKYGLDKN